MTSSHNAKHATTDGLSPAVAASSPLTIDGDVTQLTVLLAAIVDLDREAKAATLSLEIAREAAADLMLAIGRKNDVTIQHGRLAYTARIERFTRTVCACHMVDPWDCPDRRAGIILTETPKPPAAYLRAALPVNGRYDGDVS